MMSTAAKTLRHLVSMSDLTREHIEEILHRAESLSSQPTLEGKQIALLFYENSTRTYSSFRTAIHRLGGLTCGFAGTAGTSVLKGESLHDTIKMFEEYADAIVLRHPRDGASRWAADVSSVPVINAGDGQNQHPTQTLLDLLAIKRTQGRLTGLKVAMVGDLKYGRTVRSLSQALSLFEDNELYLVSPPSLRLPLDQVERLQERGTRLQHCQRLEDVISEVDICYMTRIQQERMEDPDEYERVRGFYRLRAKDLVDVKDNLKILHPLPRVDEIAHDVDRTPYAHYFEQAKGGVEARCAVLDLLIGGVL